MAETLQAGAVFEHYRIERLLGQGGMGSVYLGTHMQLGRRVAIKILSPQLCTEEEFVTRFLREARIVNEVRHPNIVDVTDFIDRHEPRRVAYVMEYIDGEPLQKALRDNGPLSLVQAGHVLLQVASALQAVHDVGVVHRDLKPDNILTLRKAETDFSRVPSVKLLDFGIAKVEESGLKTKTGMMLGTPVYMAPEQVAGEAISPKADVFACGEILYEMLTGKRVYRGKVNAILKQKLLGTLPPLDLPPDTPHSDHLRDLISRCLRQDPATRPALRQVRDAVQRLLDDDAPSLHTPAPRPSDSSQNAPVTQAAMASAAIPRERDSRAIPMLGIAAAFSLLAVIGYLAWSSRQVQTIEMVERTPPAEIAPVVPAPPPPEPAPVPPPVEPAAVVAAPVRAAPPRKARPPKRRAPRAEPAKIQSVPSGAEVTTLSGKSLGTTPVQVDGRYRGQRLKVSHQGYRPETITVSKSGRPGKVRLRKVRALPIRKDTVPSW